MSIYPILELRRFLLLLSLALCLLACGSKKEGAKGSGKASESSAKQAEGGSKPSALPQDLPSGLLVAYAQFDAQNKPGAARVDIFYRRGGEWKRETIEDPESNVFHKAMSYTTPQGEIALLTLGGSEAVVKLWRRKGGKFEAETLWKERFGGKFDRMRDAEIVDLDGDGLSEIVVGTHDQGVVAILRPNKEGKFRIERLDRRPDTFIHEIEVGDIDKDGKNEVYATPSEPNRLDGKEQSGTVVRYAPGSGRPPASVADLGKRHAKEILVADVDGDGRDELYVAVEALVEGKDPDVRILEPVEIRRYDQGADTQTGGVVIAKIDDRQCRFLTAGDVDGDGKKELVAAAFRSGLWLLRPPADIRSRKPWKLENIDRQSGGFEHAALLADLDNDKRDELYVAADDQGELRRYDWSSGKFERQVILKHPKAGALLTWNLAIARTALFAR